jgi:hypothetical protein
MLPKYGVLIGNFVSSGTHQGQWLHAILNLNVAGTPYECAVDVNEPNLGFQFKIVDRMNANLFQVISSLAHGYHPLNRNSASGAMDYARSSILQPRPVWTTVTGSEAGDALIAMVRPSQKVYVFGAPYPHGNGMHDVHCNQGDPQGSQWYPENGIWQDGCVFVKKTDGTLSTYLGMFLNQTLNTDNNGNPVHGRRVKAIPHH